MGQGQSSSDEGGGGGGGGGAAMQVKTGYYTLLGIEHHATEDEIKKAYRRKALELHPDRNYGNEEAATKTFAEVQAAYSVLSDPQERAWYDSHESTILRGEDPNEAGTVPTYQNVKITTASELQAMIGKFNSTIEFSDSPSGFFGFVRETFEHLAKEEEIAADMEYAEYREYPTFGHKDDEFGDVVKQFYNAWSGFATQKSYSWCDKYRLSEAPDRFIRRRMEQENSKARKDRRDEFNDSVRTLVQFIKKRDPRVIVDTRTEEERSKALRDAAEAQRRRAREANAAALDQEVPDWAKSREPDELDELEGTFSESDEEEEVFECVACNKIFKSEKQMDAHEKSKKHQKAVKELQKRMRKQNAHLDLDGSGIESGVATPDAEYDDEEYLDDLAAELEDEQVRSNGLEEEQIQAEEVINNQKSPEIRQDHSSEDAKEDESMPEAVDEPSLIKTTATPTTLSEDGSEEDDYASRETIEARLAATSLNPSAGGTSGDENPQSGKKKLGKAAQKRAKKAAAAAASDQQQAETSHKCSGCNEDFSSKTKLFDHLKSNPSHTALKTVAGGSKGKKKGKR